MKQPKTFRLSHQALAHLQALKDLTGSTETALVELALAHLHRLLLQELLPAKQSQDQPGQSDKRARKKRKRRSK